MQQIKYTQTSWNDIKNSPNWKKTVAILALLQLIPIFGQMVLLGFAFGWARDIAWGVHAPLPAKVFENGDDKMYSRGFFILVVMFVFSLVPSIISSLASTLASGGIVATLDSNYSPGAFAAFFGGIIGLCSMALSFAAILAGNIAGIRTAIYDRISAGFQLKKIWAMFRYDTNGALRIFGMQILIGVIAAIVLGTIAVLLSLICFGAAVPGLMALDSAGSDNFLQVMGILGPSLSIWMLLMAVVGFFCAIVTVIVQLMVARAIGYWSQQFQVAQWRGQDDPMPFEAEQAQRAAQQAQYAAQAQYAQAQAEYAQAQGQQINYAHQQAQAQYAQAQQQVNADSANISGQSE